MSKRDFLSLSKSGQKKRQRLFTKPSTTDLTTTIDSTKDSISIIPTITEPTVIHKYNQAISHPSTSHDPTTTNQTRKDLHTTSHDPSPKPTDLITVSTSCIDQTITDPVFNTCTEMDLDSTEHSCSADSDSEGSDPDDSDSEEIETLEDKLKNWAVEFNISLVALTALLCILNLHRCFSLPKDGTSIMKTPREVAIKPMDNGEYCHLGITLFEKYFAKNSHKFNILST